MIDNKVVLITDENEKIDHADISNRNLEGNNEYSTKMISNAIKSICKEFEIYTSVPLFLHDIEKYKGKSLMVPREDAVQLEEDEYYIADLIGMEVYTDGGRFGTLKDVMETGANEVYIIDSDEHGEVLVPAIQDCILDVDVEKQTMKIRLMDGLI